jgi:hypothetical protein
MCREAHSRTNLKGCRFRDEITGIYILRMDLKGFRFRDEITGMCVQG